jgi:hypothetical protein
MTDASDLPPEQEAVRRLLADARHDGPPPADVVARLDETLAALVADRGSNPLDTSRPDSSDREAAVVDLASRRRRMAGVGLLAAASVVVAGVAIGQVLPRGSGDAGTSAGSDSALAESPAEAGEDSDSPTDDSGAGDAELAPESLKSGSPTPLAGYPAVSSTDEALEERVLELRPAAVARSQYLGSADALGSCALPSLGQGRRLLAEVDGALGVVVFRRPDGGAQQAELYVCGTPDPVRTLTLPAP